VTNKKVASNNASAWVARCSDYLEIEGTEMSKITFEGKILTLQQEPYINQLANCETAYYAHATDEQDNDYTVTWQLLKYDDQVSVDEDEMCDWDKYTVENGEPEDCAAITVTKGWECTT